MASMKILWLKFLSAKRVCQGRCNGRRTFLRHREDSKKMKKLFWALVITAMVSTANADVQIANEKPKLSGPVGQAVFPSNARVCPGSPVVLTVGLIPSLSIVGGAVPVISYEVLEGNGWFGPIEEMQVAPLGYFQIMLGRFRARFGGRHAVTSLNAETGSTAIVFHPLGKDGDAIRVRAKAEGQAEDLGSVEFAFKVGTNQEKILSRMAENEMNVQKRTEQLCYQEDEFSDIKTALSSGLWRGAPRSVRRTLYREKVMELSLDDPYKHVYEIKRVSSDITKGLYFNCRYWGETDTSIVGCMTDPDPPGSDGSLMLYFFDKKTGLMNEVKFYGKRSCGWVSFIWNLDIGGGLPYTIQIQRRVWNPPTKLQETVDIIRQNIKILPDEPPSPTPTPSSYDPNKEDETPVEQP
jgi:hypothetical protein